jgi:hypothetical protein
MCFATAAHSRSSAPGSSTTNSSPPSARDEVDLAEAVCHGCSDELEVLVAEVVPACVVRRLQPVDVEHDHAGRAARDFRIVDPLLPRAPVRQPREGIHAGVAPDLVELSLEIVQRQCRAKQRLGRLGEPEADLAAEHGEPARACLGVHDREHPERRGPRSAVRSARSRRRR